MTKCRYSRDRGEYLADGEPCRVDDYGDPTRHCTARRTCANHVGEGELTCARCIGRARANLTRIVDLTHLMPTLALASGIDSEAVNLAGPACDPEAWTWRKVAARQGRAWHLSLIEDDDERHPYLVLGRWDMMIREDYDHPSDDPVSVENAAAYLDRQLGRIAQDPNQDFGLFANEIRRCRNHLEGVLRNSHAPERGAPCPECTSEETGVGPRLVREYGHWCEDEDCTKQFHYVDDAGDRWVCPKDSDHWWTHGDYSKWVEERHAAVR
jgi:hypothetical protein